MIVPSKVGEENISVTGHDDKQNRYVFLSWKAYYYYYRRRPKKKRTEKKIFPTRNIMVRSKNSNVAKKKTIRSGDFVDVNLYDKYLSGSIFVF